VHSRRATRRRRSGHLHRGGSACGSAPATAEPAPLLQLQVQLFLSSSGRVHAGYVHPAQVHFGEKSALAYDAKKRSLSSESCVYQRAKAQSYNLCAYDTRWSLTSREDVPGRGGGGAGIPSELSVVNNDGRVAVFRGRHKGAYDDDASSRAQDLLARVPDTDGCIPPDWSCDREFELLLHPELEQSASTSLPLLLAICTEGFWSQGSICHGMYSDYGDDSHGGAVDRVALLENTSCPDVSSRGYVVAPKKGTGASYFRRNEKKLRREARAELRAAHSAADQRA